MLEPSTTSIEGAGAEIATGTAFDEGATVGASHAGIGVDDVTGLSTLLSEAPDGASTTGAGVSVATGASLTTGGGSGDGSTGRVTVGD